MKKNFIAGAVCPRCSQMDTIMVCQEEVNIDPTLPTQQVDKLPRAASYRLCAACGFKDEDNSQDANIDFAAGIETRVTKKITKDPAIKPLVFHRKK